VCVCVCVCVCVYGDLPAGTTLQNVIEKRDV